MTDEAPCRCGCPNTFSTKDADGDLKRYLKHGPDRTTQALIDSIVAQGIEGATLLDIGGGIGAIQLELLARGASRSTIVDASEAYVAVSRAEADRRGVGDRVSGRFGTFEALASEIEPADIVTLDRVVCCDPDLPGLLASAAGHAHRMVGLVYPRGIWWNRLAARVMNSLGWLTRDRTRWHLHAAADIDRILTGAGFRRREIERTLVWQVALYVRP